MKKYLALCITALISLVLLNQNAVAAENARSGTIKNIKGNVSVESKGVLRAVSAGSAIFESDQIVTGKNSGAGLTLADGTVITMGANSKLDMAKFQFDAVTEEGNILVKLIRGSMRMITGLVGKHNSQNVQVTTRSATIGIRGTDFIVETQ